MRKIQTFQPNFPVRKFSVNGQFPWISGRITQKSAETVRLRGMYSPGNYVEKLVFCMVKNINNL